MQVEGIQGGSIFRWGDERVMRIIDGIDASPRLD
jgi:hypothetical protein